MRPSGQTPPTSGNAEEGMGLGTHVNTVVLLLSSPTRPTLSKGAIYVRVSHFHLSFPLLPKACRKSHFRGEAAQNAKGAANARGNRDGDGEPPRVRVSNGCVLGHDPTKGGTPHGCGVATKGE